MVNRHDFLENCEKRRKRSTLEGILEDVYNGKVWKEFDQSNGRPFLKVPQNFALMMNVDWFQPFRHSPYSIGAIYLAILNLPRL